MTKRLDRRKVGEILLGCSGPTVHQAAREYMEGLERAERRQYARHCLNAPVSFSWKTHSTRRWGEGFTRDVCARGAFVLANECPCVEATIRIEMSLPSLEGNSILHMLMKGKVVRVQPDFRNETGRGFAVVGNPILLRNKKTGATTSIGKFKELEKLANE